MELAPNRSRLSISEIKSTPAADRHRSVAPNGGGGNSRGGTARDSSSGVLSSSQEYKQFGEDIGVPGGQLTMDLIAAHNQDNPSKQVSLADLKPNSDQDSHLAFFFNQHTSLIENQN